MNSFGQTPYQILDEKHPKFKKKKKVEKEILLPLFIPINIERTIINLFK